MRHVIKLPLFWWQQVSAGDELNTPPVEVDHAYFMNADFYAAH